MNLTARERRILKLARTWGKAGFTNRYLWGAPYKAAQRQTCGRAILKLFPKAALKLK